MLQKRGEMVGGATWAKFENEGDAYEGTYVARASATAPSGNPQIVYTILTANGPVNVGRRPNDSRVHKVMEEAKYGQVVRFVFTKTIPNKKKGFHDIKAIDVVTSPSLLDMEWLKEQGATEGITPDLLQEVDSAANDMMRAVDASLPVVK